MLSDLLFGKSGLRPWELRRFQLWTRMLYTRINHARQTTGESWHDYKDRWVDPRTESLLRRWPFV
jgi:hypothetical protein